jgi:hypothetical protein
MASTRPSSTTSIPSDIFTLANNSDSEADEVDNFDTDDSETYGLQSTDCYPIRSVTFHTSDVYSVINPGVIDSSSLDQWLTFLILQFSPKRATNLDLLLHTEGEGKELERLIKKITMATEYTRRIFPRPSDDNKLKNMWLSYTKSGEPTDNGLRVIAGKGERFQVHHHLKPISTINETLKCNCQQRRSLHKKDHSFIKIRSLRDLEKASFGQIPVTSLGGLKNCRRCCAAYVSHQIQIPTTTWILTFEIEENAKIAHNDFQRRIKFGLEEWNLAYITFNGPPFENHDQLYFSLHYMGSRAFIYHGGRNRGIVKTFTDPRNLLHSRLERVVYLKNIDFDPRRN